MRILFIIMLFIMQPVFAHNIEKKIDIYNKFDSQAGKILYDFALNNLRQTSEELVKTVNIKPEAVKGYFIDLNNDDEKEIIGVICEPFYWGTSGYSLFILQKRNDKYEDISYLLNFNLEKEIYILKNRTNGYNDIMIYDSPYTRPSKRFIAKYKNGHYQNNKQIKEFTTLLNK